jgi:hypothetical protein
MFVLDLLFYSNILTHLLSFGNVGSMPSESPYFFPSQNKPLFHVELHNACSNHKNRVALVPYRLKIVPLLPLTR